MAGVLVTRLPQSSTEATAGITETSRVSASSPTTGAAFTVRNTALYYRDFCWNCPGVPTKISFPRLMITARVHTD